MPVRSRGAWRPNSWGVNFWKDVVAPWSERSLYYLLTLSKGAAENDRKHEA